MKCSVVLTQIAYQKSVLNGISAVLEKTLVLGLDA